MACLGTQHGLRLSITHPWLDLEFGYLQPEEIVTLTMAAAAWFRDEQRGVPKPTWNTRRGGACQHRTLRDPIAHPIPTFERSECPGTILTGM